MAVSHAKSNLVADMTGTVTVYNSAGATTTVAATDLVRPVDWNSGHNQYITLSAAPDGATSGSNLSGTNIVFGAMDGILLSGNTAAGPLNTLWIGQNPISYYANIREPIQGSTTMQPRQSTSAVFPFLLREPLEAGFLRMFEVGATSVASTTIATSNGANIIAVATFSNNFVIYSRGAGANSQSLQYVTSTQVVENYSFQLSANATAGSQYSVSMRYSLPGSGGTFGITKDWSASTSNFSFTSSGVTGLTGNKQVDYNFPVSLPAGQYWLAYGVSTSVTSSSTSLGLRNLVTRNVAGVSQPNISFGTLDAATNSSVGWQPGVGSWTLGGAAGTTASIGLAGVSTSSAHAIPYIQFMRIT